MADEEILSGIPKINPVTFNSYASTFFNTYLTGLTPADLLELCAALIPFKTLSDDLAVFNDPRALGDTYINASALPMMISVMLLNVHATVWKSVQVVSGGGSKAIAYMDVPPGNKLACLTVIIPPGLDYMVEGEDANIHCDGWYEIY